MSEIDWFAKNNSLVRCPHPNCDHTGTIITKAHCRLAHDMEREEVGRLYGPPKTVGNFRWDIKRGVKP